MFALQVFCIADDLTGALEIGSKFAGEGLTSRVSTRQLPACELSAGGAQAHVLDAETRHLDPAEASRRVGEISSWALRLARIIYKKTDSTLRGNIGSELRGMLASLPGTPVVYVPAYPEMGRIIRGGRLFVNGVRLEATSFAADPLNPSRESRIDALLAPDVPVRGAATPEDIAARRAARPRGRCARPTTRSGARPRCSARAACAWRPVRRRLRRRWPGGSAGRGPGRALAPVHPDLPRRQRKPERAVRRCRWTRRREWLPCLRAGATPPGARQLPVGTARTSAALGTSGLERARDVGEIVGRVLDSVEIDAMIVFGGDTAFGILRRSANLCCIPSGT